MKTYLPDDKNVKCLGRTMMTENGLWMCYSATGAAFRFHGKVLKIRMLGDDRCENADMDGNLARVKVFADGECKCDAMMNKKETCLSVFDEEQPLDAHIRVMKVSETAMSTVCLKAIETDDDAEIFPEEKKMHLVEFAGDSITCGYGVDDEVAEHSFKTDTEDATKAYAYLTCQALKADHSLVSISGYGIISGYSGDGVRRPDQLLPTYYEKMGFSYGSMQGTYPQDVAWNFDALQPELVVINLGTNDQSFTQKKEELCQEYCDEYRKFIKVIRSRNPQAQILSILGVMGTDLCAMAEKAVNDYKKETGDDKICFLPFEEQLDEDGRGADWHPSQLTHRKVAEKLSVFIREYMNW